MKFYKIRQKLISNPLSGVAGEVNRQLDSLNLNVPKGDIAITAGSRGISNIAEITKAVGDWLKRKGANPFIVPAMGSHNGATAEGQRSMIESLGITEQAMQMEIRSSMDVQKIGEVSSGEVFMDAFCAKAAGVVVLNRVKLHTCFSGPVQSGITKMMVVGMGKIQSAQTFHSTPTKGMKDMLFEMGQHILDTGKILAGVAILEDGFDQTAEIHGLKPEEILAEEPKLLQKHRNYFPGLPLEELDVLIVDQIGKDLSGTGMDTNVIGYRGSKEWEDLDKPKIKIIAALGLSEKSQGNAIGVGLADMITQRLRDAINEEKTFINVFTTGDLGRGKIPLTLPDDETVFRRLAQRFGTSRWMMIPDTLHLGTLYVSEDLKSEIEAAKGCEVVGKALGVSFKKGKHQLSFD